MCTGSHSDNMEASRKSFLLVESRMYPPRNLIRELKLSHGKRFFTIFGYLQGKKMILSWPQSGSHFICVEASRNSSIPTIYYMYPPFFHLFDVKSIFGNRFCLVFDVFPLKSKKNSIWCALIATQTTWKPVGNRVY